MTTRRPQKKEQQNPEETREITFKCKYCGGTWPLDEMKTLTRFFPPVVACRDCAEKMK